MKIKKYLLYSALTVFIFYMASSFYKIFITQNYEFSGVVQNVTYTSNHYQPIITVNNKQYDLEWVRWYDDLYKIEVGDTVVKHKYDQHMALIKRNKK